MSNLSRDGAVWIFHFLETLSRLLSDGAVPKYWHHTLGAAAGCFKKILTYSINFHISFRLFLWHFHNPTSNSACYASSWISAVVSWMWACHFCSLLLMWMRRWACIYCNSLFFKPWCRIFTINSAWMVFVCDCSPHFFFFFLPPTLFLL